MLNIISQKIPKENYTAVYDCMVGSDELVYFKHSNLYELNQQIVSLFTIDFHTMLDFMKNGGKDFSNEYFRFNENEGCLRVYSLKRDEYISIPKTFFMDSYYILKNMWTEDN